MGARRGRSGLWRRFGTTLVVTAIASMTVGLPALPGHASPRAATANAGTADPGLFGTGQGGTGVLPNFSVSGPSLIRLLAGAFDPLSDPLPHPGGIALVNEATLAPGTAQYWLVQVEGDRFASVSSAVQAAGGTVHGYLPEDTLVVRATPAQVVAVRANPNVRWAGYYQPAWRIAPAVAGRPGLLDLEGAQRYRVFAWRDDTNLGSVRSALEAIPGVEVRSDFGSVFGVQATAAQIPAIAAIPAVEWVGVKPRVVLHNYNSRWVTDTGVRDVFAATAAGRLTGAGQTAATADTAINYTYDLNGRAHVAFRDCNADGTGCKLAIYTQTTPGTDPAAMLGVQNNATGHRKMVAFFDLGQTGPNPHDESSHGSHTSGSVDGDQPPYDVYTGEDGLAPAANHVHQNLGTQGGGLALPDDDYYLWRQAYRPRNPTSVATTSPAAGNPVNHAAGCADPATGTSPCYRPLEDARTHNNSYGLLAPIVDEMSADALDRFVWDHEDMVIVVSASNDGPGAGTVTTPGVAKNDLTSGASANGRQPMTSIDSMAPFSSHGPTGDGRLGVDLATPGQIVVSVKGGTTRGYHVAQGTSMSAPVLTGLTTLVRQYFFDGYGPAGGEGFAGGAANIAGRRWNPSAALVRATLANGAVRMRGWYTGADGTDRALDGQWPSEGQGFGRVNLDNSLYFAGDATNNFYVDAWRSDSDAFATTDTTAQRSYQVSVQPGAPLDVTLAWTDAPTPAPAGTPALVNNLDLVVTAPDGTTTYVGNNMNSRTNPGVAVAETVAGAGPTDTRNNTERVRIADPAAGTWRIAVRATAIPTGRQGFALAASGLISPVGSPAFQPGPGLLSDQPGSPTISNVRVEDSSGDTAVVRFTTNEPTTATAVTDVAGSPTTFVDSYNEGGTGGFPGLDEAAVETSADFADEPVVGTGHEILLTGLSPGASAQIQVKAVDLADNEVIQTITHATPATVFQADADDIGQLANGTAGGWRTGTQLYAGRSPEPMLGAFMFRLPASFDPATITGAAVELTSAHNWMVPYTQDPLMYVDLIGPSVEANWGTQDYQTIHGAPADARLNPETTHKVGNYHTYSFGLSCGDLDDLKATLSTLTGGSRAAAFRWETTDLPGAGLFSMDFGFNRRSRGPANRPRLVLFTERSENDPFAAACDPATPAPTITDIGIHPGSDATSATVSWNTDVPSDSLVLFREQGASTWLQVGSLSRTTVHQVQVKGLDPAEEHQFVVRSAACNGATTTDTNGGAGYDFDHPPIERETFWFAGVPEDEANKQAGPPFPAGSLTWDQTAPTEGQEDLQKANFFANEDFAGNPIAAFWTAPWSGPIDEDITLDWWWSLPNATPVLGQDLIVSVFADADPATGDGTLIGRATVGLTLGQTPVRNVHTVHVQGNPTENLLIQAQPFYTVSGEGDLAHYDGTATPSNWSFVTGGGGPAGLPLTGPLPPPSAGASGLNPPATRPGPATAGEIAAGTTACDIFAPNQPPTADASVTPASAPVNQPFSFSGTGSTDDRNASGELGYEWDFTSDGTYDATGVTVQHAYPTAGSYTATLRVTDTDGAQDTDTVSVTVTSTTSAAKCPGKRKVPGNHVVGTAGDDTLTGTDGVDVICGLGGNDTLNGLGADDVLIGAGGNDVLNGGAGNDSLDGGDGVDTLNGGLGNENASGGAGADQLSGGEGDDLMKGGEGDDVLHGEGGNDSLYGERGADDLFGEAGNDLLHTKDKVSGNDELDGGIGTDDCRKDPNDVAINCE